jgi:hypothetical protein
MTMKMDIITIMTGRTIGCDTSDKVCQDNQNWPNMIGRTIGRACDTSDKVRQDIQNWRYCFDQLDH